MSIAALPRPQSQISLAVARSRAWRPTIGLVLAVSILDVLQALLGTSWLAEMALVGQLAAAVALAYLFMRQGLVSTIGAAALCAAVSLTLRAADVAQAPFLSVLAIVALGLGGAFHAGTLSDDLIGVEPVQAPSLAVAESVDAVEVPVARAA